MKCHIEGNKTMLHDETMFQKNKLFLKHIQSVMNNSEIYQTAYLWK